MHTAQDKMKRLGRLKKRSDFLCVQYANQKWISKSLIIQKRPWNEEEVATSGDVRRRFGFTVTKKVHKSAVKRNRLRRILRALAYDCLCTDQSEAHHDYVFIARKDALDLDYKELKRDIDWCLRRLKGVT